jgi:hypothetical protein
VALAFVVGVPYGARHLNDTIVSGVERASERRGGGLATRNPTRNPY